MNIRSLAFIAATFVPSILSAQAVVYTCALQSNDGLTNAELRVYEYEQTVHSAFMQFTTEYGDTLPFVFSCMPECLMLSSYDDYQYRLQFGSSLKAGLDVTLRTSSVDHVNEFVDAFTLSSCSQVRRPTE